MLRWEAGRITEIPQSDPIRRTGLQVYRAATVFTQQPHTHHLLAVPVNARINGVPGRGWHCFTFTHNQIGNSNHYYTYVSDRGAEPSIAAPIAPRWASQLLPVWYDCISQHRTRIQAGLIGDLPLLFALAAFSTPPESQRSFLNSLAPGSWIPHGQETGRRFAKPLKPRRPC